MPRLVVCLLDWRRASLFACSFRCRDFSPALKSVWVRAEGSPRCAEKAQSRAARPLRAKRPARGTRVAWHQEKAHGNPNAFAGRGVGGATCGLASEVTGQSASLSPVVIPCRHLGSSSLRRTPQNRRPVATRRTWTSSPRRSRHASVIPALLPQRSSSPSRCRNARHPAAARGTRADPAAGSKQGSALHDCRGPALGAASDACVKTCLLEQPRLRPRHSSRGCLSWVAACAAMTWREDGALARYSSCRSLPGSPPGPEFARRDLGAG